MKPMCFLVPACSLTSVRRLRSRGIQASIIWIIGEYAERIDNADEQLEHFLETFEEESAEVQLQLLTATVKLFLKQPEDTQVGAGNGWWWWWWCWGAYSFVACLSHLTIDTHPFRDGAQGKRWGENMLPRGDTVGISLEQCEPKAYTFRR